jgi:spermidine synthase
MTPEATTEPEPYSMLEWATVERAHLADGTEFVLGRHGDGWVIRAGSRVLMSNRMHASEEALAQIALARVVNPRAVLVGGLGLGYTARAVLDAVTKETQVEVIELVPELVDWNRSHLGGLAGNPLRDPRCRVIVADVLDILRSSPGAFDVVLLDVDNGPQGLTQAKNQRIYSDWGVRVCLSALKPNGVVAVWSRGPNARYLRTLERHGKDVEVLSVMADVGSRVSHVVFVATRREAAAGAAARSPSPG